LGTVATVKRDDGGCTLSISDSAPILDDCHIGDSIAVNGACLTVVEFDKTANGGWFTVWLANETLQKTDLGRCLCLLENIQVFIGNQENARSGIKSIWNGP
jgi:riboflavin synthase